MRPSFFTIGRGTYHGLVLVSLNTPLGVLKYLRMENVVDRKCVRLNRIATAMERFNADRWLHFVLHKSSHLAVKFRG